MSDQVADLTVVVNGHREGTLAHHTLRTLHRALAAARRAGLQVEVVAALDSADDATRTIFDEAAGPTGYLREVSTPHILEVAVADLGEARNLAIAQASAPYVALLDADNLPSQNWFVEAHRAAIEHDGPCVVHPEVLVIFEGRQVLWPQWATADPRFRVENFYDRNYWDAACLASREVFEAHPYHPTPRSSGFGPEDWHWYADVLHAGVPHVAAGDTALFYRAKLVGSLMGSHTAGRSLIQQTPLLTDPEIARAVKAEAEGFGRRGPTRRTPLLRRIVREGNGKRARRTADSVAPAPMSRAEEAMSRLRPGFVHPTHYRFLYDLGELSDAEARADFHAHGDRRGWLTAGELDSLHPRMFRVDHYRALHHDLVHLDSAADLRVHWLEIGRGEGRRARLTRVEVQALARLDLDDYRDRHLDLTDHDDHQLVQHYLEHGIEEGRLPVFPIAERTHGTAVAISDDLAAEWRAMHRFEPWVLIPSETTLASYHYVGPPYDGSLTQGSAVWWQVVAALEDKRPDAVFFAPWVRMGGGDLLLARYAQALVDDDPSLNVVVVTTHGESTRPDLLDPAITFVDLPAMAGFTQMDAVERQRLVATIVTQFRPRLVHVFNAPEAFDAVQSYGRSMSAHSRLFLSTFAIDYGPEGEIYSQLARRPVDYLEVVEKVIVDNFSLVDEFHQIYRMDRDKFAVHHQPVDLPPTRPRKPRGKGLPLQVMWAARFDRQKRLDILADVAEAAANAGLAVDWHVYGAPVIADAEESQDAVERLHAVGARFHGTYASFAALPLDDFDLFLLTSENEGIPLTLLDVLAHRLPVMAPLVGGIAELVSEETGWPIEQFDDIDAYVASLEQVAAHREVAERRADAGHALLADDFSWDAFHRRLRETPHYLP